MHLSVSLSTAAIILSILQFNNALPTSGDAGQTSDPNNTATISKRQNIPNNINIGINEKRHSTNGKGMWTAWVNGEDPCHHHSDLGVYEDEASPCNIRFSLDNYDYQYTMQGCGGNLWLMRNGKDNVGSCYWAPGKKIGASDI
ncbi:hypothetical protein AJ79_08307 [Helicocarpus griseus UAMH5409]|uniref:Uncharacterized protein n=1 Tax=Helicocarpus griseus UAMH5409 TaxID=1447875 RepID=A0A2B7WL74_9EURO|nr:hypothetical protein AJ79_08307 [Helicocarpus griseus UAMH5409]